MLSRLFPIAERDRTSACLSACQLDRMFRFEPVLVIVEVESSYEKDPPQDVGDGCRSPVVVVDRGDQAERMADRDEE